MQLSAAMAEIKALKTKLTSMTAERDEYREIARELARSGVSRIWPAPDGINHIVTDWSKSNRRLEKLEAKQG